MAKQTSIVKPEQGIVEAIPDFIASQEIVGVDDLQGFMIVPRVKTVQPSSADLKADFAEGSVLVMPNRAVLFSPPGRGENPVPFKFVPMLFFVEWLAQSDIKLKGKAPMIRERSLDPASDLAIKSRDPKTRVADDPEFPGMKIKYVEVLNFVVKPMGIDGFNDAAVMGFSKSNHQMGRRLATLIRARKAPIYACVFEAVTLPRKNDQGSWYGMEVSNPATGAWVTKEQLDSLKSYREELEAFFKKGKLKTVDDVEDEPAPTPSDQM